MNHNLTQIVAILDRSGSMSMLASDVIGGVNRLVQEQRDAGANARPITPEEFIRNLRIFFQGRTDVRYPDGPVYAPYYRDDRAKYIGYSYIFARNRVFIGHLESDLVPYDEFDADQFVK